MTRLLKLLKRRQGQNTVEYLLMLAVVIAVVVIVGGYLKQFLPETANKIKDMLNGAVDGFKTGGG